MLTSQIIKNCLQELCSITRTQFCVQDTAGNVIVEGTSDYTITVNSYVAEADFSEAAEAPETEEETAAITIEDSGSLIGSLIEAIQKVH